MYSKVFRISPLQLVHLDKIQNTFYERADISDAGHIQLAGWVQVEGIGESIRVVYTPETRQMGVYYGTHAIEFPLPGHVRPYNHAHVTTLVEGIAAEESWI